MSTGFEMSKYVVLKLFIYYCLILLNWRYAFQVKAIGNCI